MNHGTNPLMCLSLGGIIRRWWKLGSRTCSGAVDDQGCVLEYTLYLVSAFSFLPDCCDVSHSHHVFLPHDRPRKQSHITELRSQHLWAAIQLSPLLWPSQILITAMEASLAPLVHKLPFHCPLCIYQASPECLVSYNNASHAQIDYIVSHRTNHLVPKLTTNGYT